MRALLCVLSILSGAASARADDAPLAVRYEVNATEVRQGDTFQLDVIVTVRAQEPLEELVLPELSRHFTILQERRASSTQVAIGRTRQATTEQRYVYLLRADEAGSFKIPEAAARAGRHTARAAPIHIKVHAVGTAVDDDQGPRPGARFGKSLPPLFVELVADRATAWVGQQVTVTTEIYTQRPLTQLPRLPPLKPPGFFCDSLLDERRPPPTERIIDGRTYYVYVVNRDALFPLSPGEKTIPAITIDVAQGSLLGRSRDAQVHSLPLRIDVRPLPAEAQRIPPGNVGHWQLTSSIRPTRAALGEPFTLSVVAVGTGSLEQLAVPTWDGGGQARVFPATRRVDEKPATGPGYELGGRVTLEMLVQPLKEGELRIPALTLAYFDPVEGAVRESSTTPLVVTVGPARDDASPRAWSGAKQTLTKGPRPLQGDVRLTPMPGDAPVVFGLAAFALGLCARIGVDAARRRRMSSAGRRAAERKERLARLKDAAARGDLQALERIVLDAVADAFGGEGKARATSELGPILEAQGAEPALVERLVRFIHDVESARFLPGAGAERERLAQEAEHLVERLAEKRP